MQLYATTNDGAKVLALTGSSGFGNTITGTFSTVATAPANTLYRGIAFAPTGQTLSPAPVVTPSNSALSAALGDSFEPTVTATVADSPAFTADELTLTATSSDQAVAADGGIAISSNGTTGPRTISITPAGAVGYATITLTATTPNGVVGQNTIRYGVSAAAPDAASAYLYGSGSDASTAVDVGDGYFIVGDDEYDTLAMYASGSSGEPVKTWNFTSLMGNPGEMDIEASARLGNTIYWLGSMGNNSSGKLEPDRAAPVRDDSEWVGRGRRPLVRRLLREPPERPDQLGREQRGPFGFATGAAVNQPPKQLEGFNAEGLEFAADGSGTAYIGFRSPIVPPETPQNALVVPVTNLASLVTGAAAHATFGTPLEWNLTPPGYVNGNGDPSKLGIREIRKNADNQHLIIAGSYEGVPAAPGGGSQFLYTWDGNPAHQPVLTNTVLPTPDGGSWESVISVPDPLVDGAEIRMIEDDGGSNPYGDPDGTELKDLAFGLQKDHADVFGLALATQTIGFTTTPASPAYAGTKYVPAGSGGASGNPVTFGIDATSSPRDVLQSIRRRRRSSSRSRRC